MSEAPTVWVLEIWHKHGADISVHATKQDASDTLLSYVDQWWEKELAGITRPARDDMTIVEYFDQMHEREGYEIHETKLSGAKSIELEVTDA